MKRYLAVIALLATLPACNKSLDPYQDTDYDYGRNLSHDMIVLGDRLENPYTTTNVQKAYTSLYPTRARTDVKPTDLYVRFLPANEAESERLLSLGIDILDHPLDYSIVREGDYYIDPEVGEDRITWQYAVVPIGFEFPDIRYEVIDECFIAENAATKASDVDWEAVEREAFRLTGNAGMLVPQTKAANVTPSGRITIVDDEADGGKPVGLAGVMVLCNTFVKFGKAYTDADGYYSINKKFSSNIRYRIVFKNERSFALGFNFILVQGSVSTLGKAEATGVNYTVTSSSDERLFRRCAVNNAVYDYITRCGADDLGITPPPSDLRIWILPELEASAAIMMHHGTAISRTGLSKLLGKYSPILTFFAPDITIGTSDKVSFKDIYSYTCHELAHASHFAKVGKDWWDEYIMYVLTSFLKEGTMYYGDGTEDGAGYCEVGEMWGYYMQSKVHKDRYGGNMPAFGTSWWFYPQIFNYLDERGLSSSEIFAALAPDVNSRDKLQDRLCELYPAKKSVINQVFQRYK